MLEYLVHIGTEENLPPSPLTLLTLEVDDTIPPLIPSSLPLHWDDLEIHPDVQCQGSAWLANVGMIVVPSVVVPEEMNYVLNPSYQGYADKVTILEHRNWVMDIRLRK